MLLSTQKSLAYLIRPGTGLRSTSKSAGKSFAGGEEIVIFEHTEMGTGGLVLNCPTPLNIGNLPIPRFQAFKDLPLMLGCGMEDGDSETTSEEIPLGEVSPWFWLHDLQDIPGSFEFTGAAAPLYMGGNIEEATKRLKDENIDPMGHFKFFRKYKSWEAGALEAELNEGKWEVVEQDPVEALKPVKSGVRLP